jgi:hypothetical protein
MIGVSACWTDPPAYAARMKKQQTNAPAPVRTLGVGELRAVQGGDEYGKVLGTTKWSNVVVKP